MVSDRPGNHHLFTALCTGLILLAWLELALWSLSPYARYLDHEALAHLPFSLSAEYLTLITLFLLGWLLMSIAMMLPSSLPLILLFRRMTARRADAARLTFLLIAGYLGVWLLFGALAHLGDLLVHGAVHAFSWLEANPWAIGAATLGVAGTYQFSPLKYACLDKCRSPLSFIAEHWRGTGEQRQAFFLGVHHGLFCIGCCWSLMLLMFVVGMANLGWMLLLGAVMVAEKNLPWGRRLSRPLGLALLGWGLWTAVAALA